jgi:hypothetical protein
MRMRRKKMNSKREKEIYALDFVSSLALDLP